MRLTRFTDLCLRVLIYLSQNSRPELIKISQISEQFDLSRNHLVKVVNLLVKLGWINAIRGPNGGLRLAVQLEELKLGDVIQIVEGRTSLINCDEPPCILAGYCCIHGVLNKALDDFYLDLNKYTLADMVKGQTKHKVRTLHRQYLSLKQIQDDR